MKPTDPGPISEQDEGYIDQDHGTINGTCV